MAINVLLRTGPFIWYSDHKFVQVMYIIKFAKQRIQKVTAIQNSVIICNEFATKVNCWCNVKTQTWIYVSGIRLFLVVL
jgi:hypothetical protein